MFVIYGSPLCPDCYTFVSCVTAPKFRCEGFRLVPADEVREMPEP